MPKIIRRALVEKFAASPEWVAFREDFLAATGFQLEVVDELGRRAPVSACAGGAFCCDFQAGATGAEACQKFRQSLLARASKSAVSGTCAAGLCEVVVPLKIGAVTAGYLVFGGFRVLGPEKDAPESPGKAEKRPRLPAATRKQKALWNASTVLSEQKIRAYTRFVELAVRLFSERMTLHLASADNRLPEPVVKACRFIKRECLIRPVTLRDVAVAVGMSEGHFSRVFHHSTGLTFGEYVARQRVDKAREMLKDPRVRVTDVAFACGFQSLSQFHRVFRKIVATSPRDFRRALALD